MTKMTKWRNNNNKGWRFFFLWIAVWPFRCSQVRKHTFLLISMIILPFVTCVRSGISCSPSYCCNTFGLHELPTFTTIIIVFFFGEGGDSSDDTDVTEKKKAPIRKVAGEQCEFCSMYPFRCFVMTHLHFQRSKTPTQISGENTHTHMYIYAHPLLQ